MIELRLRRTLLGEKVTLGELTADRGMARESVFRCHTLEDRYRPPPEPKVPRETCIPLGRYQVKVTYSPRFKTEVPLLLAVPGFTGVRIHPGNTAADTEGCILVGLSTNGVDKVLESRAAYETLLRLLQLATNLNEPIFINVELGSGVCL